MKKRIRTTLAAVLVALTITLSAGPLDGILGIHSTESVYAAGGGVKLRP